MSRSGPTYSTSRRQTLLSSQTGSRRHGPRSTLHPKDTNRGVQTYNGSDPGPVFEPNASRRPRQASRISGSSGIIVGEVTRTRVRVRGFPTRARHTANTGGKPAREAAPRRRAAQGGAPLLGPRQPGRALPAGTWLMMAPAATLSRSLAPLPSLRSVTAPPSGAMLRRSPAGRGLRHAAGTSKQGPQTRAQPPRRLPPVQKPRSGA